jgi:type VI protein secretion system component VasF
MLNVEWLTRVVVAVGVLTASAGPAQQILTSQHAVEHTHAEMIADDRQKKMLADADQLLAMAQQLKSAVDQARKDELSLQVIKQADQIEKLAKSVKDRMRQ